MRSPSVLLASLSFALAIDSAVAAVPSLSLSNILFSTYWAFTTPSHLALNKGTIDFTITNSAVDDNIVCSGVNSNSWAVFYPTTVYHCTYPDGDEGKEKEVGVMYDPYCWTDSASFTLDTTTQGTRNLSVEMTWTCAEYVNPFPSSSPASVFYTPSLLSVLPLHHLSIEIKGDANTKQ
jgi:hypothetical protein